MTYTPPGYTPEPESGKLTAGVYPNCVLAKFAIAKDPGKFDARVVFIAEYRDTDSNNDVTDFIKFGTGHKSGDYYAGLRIERLHTLLGLPLPSAGEAIDPEALMACAEGAFFCVEMVGTVSNGKTYTNIKDVRGYADVDVPSGV